MPDEFGDRLASRTSEFGLDPSASQRAQFEAYFRLLERWNAKINLTALRLRPLTEPALDRLLIEPLLAAGHIADSSITWFDLGSGGGSPAIPLKILRPHLRLTMVEATAKKAAFLREVVTTLGLADAVVENCRFEDLAGVAPRHTAEFVTARAVRGDAALLNAVWRLLSPAGHFWFFRSKGSFSLDSALFRPVLSVPLIGQAVLDILSPASAE